MTEEKLKEILGVAICGAWAKGYHEGCLDGASQPFEGQMVAIIETCFALYEEELAVERKLIDAALAFHDCEMAQISDAELEGTQSASAPAEFMNFMDAVKEYRGGTVKKTCPDCRHSLKDNSHGFDQNDACMDGEKLVHSGRCTYCRICNPRIFEDSKKK